ncbi:MAG TPA: hypothetical protein DCS24_03000 [Erythrobacter sp.]|nr:hypothetical protein [Erythrobacter sp.]
MQGHVRVIRSPLEVGLGSSEAFGPEIESQAIDDGDGIVFRRYRASPNKVEMIGRPRTGLAYDP